MFGHLERIRVELTVKSPLFIGNGQNLTQKEYIICGKKWIIPSMQKLLSELVKRNLIDAFESYLTSGSTKSLTEWLISMGIRITENEPWVLYSIPSSNLRGNVLNVMIKDAEGRPYIPGSSIKGAIRTALIASRMDAMHARKVIEDANAVIEAAKKVDYKKKQNVKLSGKEEEIIRTLKFKEDRKEDKKSDAVNDLLRGIEVSDSAPFAPNSLIVCQKTDAHLTHSTREEKDMPMPLFRECVAPGSKTVFYLTIDHNILPKSFIKELTDALNKWDQHLTDYASSIELYKLSILDPKCPAGSIPITLGGGVGFQSKSLIYPAADFCDKIDGRDIVDIVDDVLSAQFYKTYKYENADGAASPYCRKLTQYNKAYMPFGKCSMKLVDQG